MIGEQSELLNQGQLKADNVGIHLQNVWKAFSAGRSTYHVLKGLTLTVPCGTIYGLLGPSGCGKTTLLKCVLGRTKIDVGSLTVMGQPPGSRNGSGSTYLKPTIGYMPQDISLNANLSVKETFHLFGAVCGVNRKELKARSEFLLKLLGITNLDKCISQLSGGQQRRVSFAIALLHEPTLLILDEPTVGVDPLLRKSIWDYLNTMVNNRLTPATIIITTHYIEEARMAHNVGLMLDGQLLAEDAPELLIRQYECVTLEQVFLKLCLTIEDVTYEQLKSNEAKPLAKTKTELNCNEIGLMSEKDTNAWPVNASKGNDRKTHCVDSEDIPRWHRIQALFIKNILFFARHLGLLLFEIILPPIIIIIFTFTIGTPLYGLPVGVVNHDSMDLSQFFLDSIDHQAIHQYHYENYEEAQRATSTGAIMGIIYINSHFSNSTRTRFQEGPLANSNSLNDSEISITLDWSSQQVAFAINTELLMALRRFAQKILYRMGLNPTIGDLPIKFENRQVYGDLKISFDQFLLPGIIVCVAFFMAMTLTGISLILEKKAGSLERLSISGVVSIEFILSHLLAQISVVIAQVCLMLVTPFALLGFSCKGSYLWVVLLSFLQAFCGMNLGFVIAAIFDSETMALMISLGIWMFFLFSQGYLWPVEAMDEVIRFISRMLPQTMSIEAMRSIINRSWDPSFPQVSTAFLISFGWALAFLLLAWLIARKKI